MTRIAICDTRHFEVTYTILSLFDKTDTQITVFLHAEAYEQLHFLLGERTNSFTWVIKGEKESNRRFINRMFYEIKKASFDLLYLNTVADNFINYAYHLKKLKIKKVVMTLHDINGSFRYPPGLRIRRIVRYTGKRLLIRRIPAFNVLSENLVLHLLSKLQGEKQVYNVPGSFFRPESFIKKEYRESEIIKIVVPGSVDNRRRNYGAVFELLEQAKKSDIAICVTLLGSFSATYGGDIKKKCVAYNRANNNLFFYSDDIVPQKDFDRAIHECHFVWMPLQPFVIINDGIQEEYGTSICSGNIGDVIRYARPFFAPVQLAVDLALQESRCSYKQVSEIASTIQNLRPQDYIILQEKALAASLYYTREKIIERNLSLFA